MMLRWPRSRRSSPTLMGRMRGFCSIIGEIGPWYEWESRTRAAGRRSVQGYVGGFDFAAARAGIVNGTRQHHIDPSFRRMKFFLDLLAEIHFHKRLIRYILLVGQKLQFIDHGLGKAN